MALASWANKLPADMTNEELQECRTLLGSRMGLYASRLSSLQEAAYNLDYQIAVRFGMDIPPTPPPPFPLDAVAAEAPVIPDPEEPAP